MLSQREILFRLCPMALAQLSRCKATATTWVDQVSIDQAKPFEDIPGPSGIWTVKQLGTRLMFYPFTKYKVETFHNLLDEYHTKYGSIFKFRVGVIWMVVTINPEDFGKVFKHEGNSPVRRPLELMDVYYNRTGNLRSLAFVNGKEWQRIRGAVQAQVVRPTSAQHYLPIQNQVTDQFVERLRMHKFTPTELADEFMKYACEAIGVVAFNSRLGCFEENFESTDTAKFIRNVTIFFKTIHHTLGKFPLFKYIQTPMYKEFEAAYNEMFRVGQLYTDRALQLVESEQKKGTLNLDEPNFLLSLLSGGKLSVPEITSVALDLFNGGTDSTAKNLSFLLYHLAKNPDKQEKLYQEVIEVLGEHGDLTAKALNNMPYLKACVRESFRLAFPITAGTSRVLQKDVVLSGYYVPKWTAILANNRRVCLSDGHFDQADEFLPERWLREKESGKREKPIPTLALLPFGFGSRNCLGRRFAEQEMYLTASKIVRNLHVELGDNKKVPIIIYHTFVTTKEPIDLVFRERRQ